MDPPPAVVPRPTVDPPRAIAPLPAAAPPPAAALPPQVALRALSSRPVALLLASAALLAAILAARASFASNDASGAWQSALRQEVKSQAATVEDIRFVYGDEARGAYRYAVTRVREDEFRKAAQAQTGEVREALLIEADVQTKLGEWILSSSEVASDPAYVLPDGGYDIVKRLADTRARSPDILALPPAGSPLDAVALRTISADIASLSHDVLEQRQLVTLGEETGRRSGRAVLGLSLVALAGVIVGLSAVLGEGQAGAVALMTATGATILAAIAGATAVIPKL